MSHSTTPAVWSLWHLLRHHRERYHATTLLSEVPADSVAQVTQSRESVHVEQVAHTLRARLLNLFFLSSELEHDRLCNVDNTRLLESMLREAPNVVWECQHCDLRDTTDTASRCLSLYLLSVAVTKLRPGATIAYSLVQADHLLGDLRTNAMRSAKALGLFLPKIEIEP